MSLKDLPLPSIASLRAIAALRSPHLALVRPARIGLGFESAGANQKTLLEVEELLGGPGRLSLSYSLRWLLDAMTGLGVLHRTLGFVHGEVQPEHLVLGEDGVGRLIPVVRAHWVRGEERAAERLYYLAPEKLLGDTVDVRSDVFSIGVLLWEALSGQRLLEAFEVDDIIARLMSGGIPRAQAPEAESWTAPLAAVADRALAVDPGRRFATVAEMKDAIESACSRYLASAPGMAELFENPAIRARNVGRDSRPPESQRVTLPPAIEPGSTPYAADPHTTSTTVQHVSQAMLRSAHEGATTIQQVSQLQAALADVEDELTTHPKASPMPVARKGAHVNTLLGVAPPIVERDSSPPDELTIPRGQIPVPSPLHTPLPPTPTAVKPASMPPRSMTPPQSFAAPQQPLSVERRPYGSIPPQPLPSARPPAAASASPPRDTTRGVSLAPLVAAPATRAPAPLAEPSFELVTPRKRRGALWLVLGAAAAIGIFAARPWLARQVAAATGMWPETAVDAVEPAPTTPVITTTGSLPGAIPSADDGGAVPSANATALPVGIASTPAVPSAPPARGRAPAEAHVVIHDVVDPSIRELARPKEPPAVAAPAPTRPPAAAEPPAPTTPPAPPPPPAKPKEVPVSDADRYGI